MSDGDTSSIWPPAGGARPASGRGDTEDSPSRTGKPATEGGQQRTIGMLICATPHLAPEDCHFTAKGEQPDFLGLFGTKQQEDRPEEVIDGEIGEGPQLATCSVPSHRVDVAATLDALQSPGGGGDRVFGYYESSRASHRVGRSADQGKWGTISSSRSAERQLLRSSRNVHLGVTLALSDLGQNRVR